MVDTSLSAELLRKQTIMAHVPLPDQHDNPWPLAYLMSLWPVASNVTEHLGAGDLIALSRTSTDLRSTLHGGYLNACARSETRQDWDQIPLRPPVGQHQTPYWVNLKSKSRFVCASKTHTKGDRARGCVYCSKPICEACIVRDSFKRQNENTFRNRYRHLCSQCWSDGRPVKHFRYAPVDPILLHSGEQVSHQPGNVDEYAGSEETCRCTLKDNGWLCLGCKEEQNSSTSAISHTPKNGAPLNGLVTCEGHSCSNRIDPKSPETIRCRICLWCEKPLKRSFGGEAGYRKQHTLLVATRAVSVLSRAQEMQEYNRVRNRSLKMSRCELRGLQGSEHEKLTLVRHLDATNYRNFLDDRCCPSPEAVWKSKLGYWRYEIPFLQAVGTQTRCDASLKVEKATTMQTQSQAEESKLREVTRITRENGLSFSQTNREVLRHNDLFPDEEGLLLMKNSRLKMRVPESMRARVLDAYLDHDDKTPKMTIQELRTFLREEYGVKASSADLVIRIRGWVYMLEPTMGVGPSAEETSRWITGKHRDNNDGADYDSDNDNDNDNDNDTDNHDDDHDDDNNTLLLTEYHESGDGDTYRNTDLNLNEQRYPPLKKQNSKTDQNHDDNSDTDMDSDGGSSSGSTKRSSTNSDESFFSIPESNGASSDQRQQQQ